MTNKNLKTNRITKTSRILENGLWAIQVIFLWETQAPYTNTITTGGGDCPPEESQEAADIIDWMHGRRSPGDPHVATWYQSLAGFEIRYPTGASYRYLRPHIEAGENAKRPTGPPLAENRVDYSTVDWSKPDAVIGRELGVSRQTVYSARRRHAPETVPAKK